MIGQSEDDGSRTVFFHSVEKVGEVAYVRANVVCDGKTGTYGRSYVGLRYGCGIREAGQRSLAPGFGEFKMTFTQLDAKSAGVLVLMIEAAVRSLCSASAAGGVVNDDFRRTVAVILEFVGRKKAVALLDVQRPRGYEPVNLHDKIIIGGDFPERGVGARVCIHFQQRNFKSRDRFYRRKRQKVLPCFNRRGSRLGKLDAAVGENALDEGTFGKYAGT